MFSYLQRDLDNLVIEWSNKLEDGIHKQIFSGALSVCQAAVMAGYTVNMEDIPGNEN